MNLQIFNYFDLLNYIIIFYIFFIAGNHCFFLFYLFSFQLLIKQLNLSINAIFQISFFLKNKSLKKSYKLTRSLCNNGINFMKKNPNLNLCGGERPGSQYLCICWAKGPIRGRTPSRLGKAEDKGNGLPLRVTL